MRTEEFKKQIKKMFKCDSVRIIKPLDRSFLIIGFKRNTKDEENQWYKNSEPFDFDYLKEETIANGKTLKELLSHAKYYKKLTELDWSNPKVIKKYIEELRVA